MKERRAKRTEVKNKATYNNNENEQVERRIKIIQTQIKLGRKVEKERRKKTD